MKKLWWLALGALFAAVPALAGHTGGKCTYDTQTCLNHLGEKRDAGWLGLELEMHDKDGKALESPMVKKITEASPASAAGLQVGDFLLTLNGAKMSDKEAMKKARGDWKPGSKVTYNIRREGKEMPVAVTLAKMPEDVYTRMVGNHMISDHMAVATADANPAVKEAPVKQATAKEASAK